MINLKFVNHANQPISRNSVHRLCNFPYRIPPGKLLLVPSPKLIENILIFLKNAVAYIFILLFSMAYSYETVKYISKVMGGTSVSWMDDFHCEEKSPESEESTEKNEKVDFLDDLYLTNKRPNSLLLSGPLELSSLWNRQNNIFSSTDFSQEVYSPPEMQ